ncbi:hypothetical protein QSJ18_16135 [Gordonia sp. ABSL1-1]|uniref:hypothetical protein n=1 Tax=Gordonia sp. ABSL1-1 TaxID=3053923 RepID=UPI002572818C|nr:hypothetical protein [Gordonia sp. ABSL1-1]MDL9938281.1 hypothetical protein [Gordonia sp. ABSL1-1]
MTPRKPKGLGTEGAKLWKAVTADYDLTPAELTLLERAARELDVIARLQNAVDEADELWTRGSMGQRVELPELKELRLHTATYQSLIRQLDLPEDDGEVLVVSVRSTGERRIEWQS